MSDTFRDAFAKFSVTYAHDTKRALVNSAGFVVVSLFVWPVLTNVGSMFLGLKADRHDLVLLVMPTTTYRHLVLQATTGGLPLRSSVAVLALVGWCVVPVIRANHQFISLDVA